MQNFRSQSSYVALSIFIASIFAAIVVIPSLSTSTSQSIVIGVKRRHLVSQDDYLFKSNTALVFEAPTIAGWSFDYTEIDFSQDIFKTEGVTGSNVSQILAINGGRIQQWMDGSATRRWILGERDPTEVKNISPIDMEIDVWAYSYYSQLTTATMTDNGNLREVQFSVQTDSSNEDEFTIHWNGSCVLQQLYAPNGQDMLQLSKKEVNGLFKWGFVHFTFNPIGLANVYGFDGHGDWRIQMKVVDATAPSLCVSDEFRVSIHRRESSLIIGFTNIAPGQSYAFPMVPFPWNTQDWYCEEVTIEMNADPSRFDVEGALLDVLGPDLGYWKVYNQTIKVTNIWTQPLSLGISSITEKHFGVIDHKVSAQSLEFTLNSADYPFEDEHCSLDIVATVPLSSSTLRAPNESRAEDLHRTLGNEYYTPELICGVRKVSFNPYFAWKVLENGVYGTWRLELEASTHVHDVAVISVKPRRMVVDQNYVTKINVTVANQGNFIETFNVTVYANSRFIETQTLTLDGEETTNVTFVWNTSEVQMSTLPGNCALLVTASIVQNETYIANNNSTCYINISIKGDVNADGKVNLKDIFVVAKAFESHIGQGSWNPDADVNEDEKVNLKDMFVVAKAFGKTV